jgi:hypothetical protein
MLRPIRPTWRVLGAHALSVTLRVAASSAPRIPASGLSLGYSAIGTPLPTPADAGPRVRTVQVPPDDRAISVPAGGVQLVVGAGQGSRPSPPRAPWILRPAPMSRDCRAREIAQATWEPTNDAMA